MADDINALSIVCEFFTALENRQVRHCHWKSNQHLADALSGRTDIDLLVDKQQATCCESVLLRLGYKRFDSQPWARYPGMEDWIGLDAETGQLVHIHLHYQLVMGKKFIKELHLPWESLVLSSATKDARFHIWVTDPNLEILILLIRIGLKTSMSSLFNALWSGRVALPKNILNEFEYLLTQIDEDAVQAYADDLFSHGSAVTLLSIIHNGSIDRASSVLKLKSVANELLNQYRRTGKIQALGIRTFRRVSAFYHRACRKLRLCERRGKRLHSGGVFIAVIGCDGSGKSTVSRELYQWLSWKIDTRLVYLGSGDGPVDIPTRLLQRTASSFAPKRSASFAADTPRRRRKSRRFSLRRFGSDLLASSLAASRHKKVMTATRDRVNGTIIITDRFPQNQFVGIFDGPKLDGNEPGQFLHGYFAQLECQKYQEMADSAPDLIVKLLLPADVAISRKADHNIDNVRRKAEITSRLEFLQSEVVDIDATASLDEVLRTAKLHIWNML